MCGVLTIAQILDFVIPCQLGDHNLTADRSRCILSSAIPVDQGAEDIVEAHQPGLHATVLATMSAQALRHQYLPPVRVLRICRVRMFLRQRHHISLPRAVYGTDTGPR